MDHTPPQEAREPIRVVVVEDDLLLGRVVQRLLTPLTTETVVVRTGQEGLAALTGGCTAMAVDISLPDMSGLEVISRARALSPRTGVVAITGYVDVDIAVQAMKAGADDFLAKPFDAVILWHLLNKAADTRRRHLESEKAELYRQLAYTDALTGAPNRRFVDEFIVDSVHRARISGEDLIVAYLDIDNFKLLNDFVGHEQGDAVLQRVAAELNRLVRQPAVYGRFGGDEFVAAFPGPAASFASEAIERLRVAVAAIEVVNGAHIALPMRVSCGLAPYRGVETPRELIAEAEEQMYLDKSISSALLGNVMELTLPEARVKISNLKALRNLVRAIDRRDSYTRFHSDHATQLALELASETGLDVDQANAITIAGPIHDLGKIVVPDEVLRKPGPLSAEERRTMEEHPVIGAAITAAVTDYDTVVDLVRHHHERFDGDGYPGRLKGERISLPTRIFAVADAYSAMTTDRPYRRALTTDQAIGQILAGRGTQFDPDLGLAFAALMERRHAGDEDAA